MTDAAREERGPKVPGFNLEACVGLLDKVRDGVGMGAAARDTVARAMGYGSLNGTSKRAIGALSHFGLIDRSGSAAIRISDLGKRVLLPRNDAERQAAIVEAAKRPALYEKLFERYEGHALPSLLPNILVRDFQVYPASSEDAARTFRESMEFAGLLSNGILRAATHDSGEAGSAAGTSGGQEEPVSGSPDPVSVPSAPLKSGPSAERQVESNLRVQHYTIPLDGRGRVATIEIPLPVSAGDLNNVGRWAKYMAEFAEDN